MLAAGTEFVTEDNICIKTNRGESVSQLNSSFSRGPDPTGGKKTFLGQQKLKGAALNTRWQHNDGLHQRKIQSIFFFYLKKDLYW